jgi:hypothetical protein
MNKNELRKSVREAVIRGHRGFKDSTENAIIEINKTDIFNEKVSKKGEKKMKKGFWLGFFGLVAVCLFSGCLGVSESIKGLNMQNYQASDLIISNTDDVVVKGIATDIKANSQSIAITIGEPSEAVSYSAENSSKLRDLASQEKESASAWNNIIKNTAESLPYGATVLSLIAGVGAFIKKNYYKKTALTLIQGGENFISQVKDKDVVEAFKTAQGQVQNAVGLYSDINTLIKSLRK